MTTEEKLKHFTSVTMENVQADCNAMVKEYKEKMDEYLKEHKENTIKNAKLQASIAEDGIRRKASQEYTSMQMHLKRKINHKNVELKDRLFTEVRALLDEFIKTEEYEKYVTKKVTEMKEFAGKDELIIVLDKRDEKFAETIAKADNIVIEISEKSFIGGVIGKIPSRNILIDESFETKFTDIKEEYTIAGGR